jgi:hypothetical protein
MMFATLHFKRHLGSDQGMLMEQQSLSKGVSEILGVAYLSNDVDFPCI